MKTVSLPIKEKYLELKAQELLDKYGSGGHKPGSGSAAALVGVLASKLLRTVISLTLNKEAYRESQAQLRLGNKNVIDRIEPILINFVQTDAENFHQVIQARRLRDKSTDPKERRRFGAVALRRQKKATDIPLLIADSCIELSRFGMTVYDLGFKSARGDSGVAINAALSAANGALFIVYLNLKDFKDGYWAIQTRNKADTALLRTKELQEQLFRRVVNLQDESRPNPQMTLRF